MRTLSSLAVVGLAALLPLATPAMADEHAGKVTYKDGLRIAADDFDVKFNVQLQPRFTYTDNDVENRIANGAESADADTASFDLRRARFVISGNALDKKFSFKLQNDFASSSGGGDMKDAWIQWNGDAAKIKFGQYKQPFGREIRISSTKLFFTDRTAVTGTFGIERAQGAQISGALGEMANWYASVNNGNSSGEGRNREGQDNNVQGVVAVDFSTEGYGSRGMEGDFREDGAFAATAGAGVAYGEGTIDGIGDYSEVDLNADVGIRVEGLELWGEYYYATVDPDVGGSDIDASGFFVSAAYNIDDTWGAGVRFALEDNDAKPAVDTTTEYAAVLNYFINGHYLKLQNSVTFTVDSAEGSGEDVTDFAYVLQLAGYF